MRNEVVVREKVRDHLKASLPVGMVEHFFDTWLTIDADEETPAVMVYFDSTEANTEYLDIIDSKEGVLVVSIYLGVSAHDRDLDEIGGQIEVVMPSGFRVPGIVRFIDFNSEYERSDTGAYRALHINYSYKWE